MYYIIINQGFPFSWLKSEKESIPSELIVRRIKKTNSKKLDINSNIFGFIKCNFLNYFSSKNILRLKEKQKLYAS